jgi:hypothetical protein
MASSPMIGFLGVFPLDLAGAILEAGLCPASVYFQVPGAL